MNVFEKETLNDDLERQSLALVHQGGAFWLVQTLLVYLWACMVAGKPIGPKDYVRFGYHMIQWQSPHTPTQAALLTKR